MGMTTNSGTPKTVHLIAIGLGEYGWVTQEDPQRRWSGQDLATVRGLLFPITPQAWADLATAVAQSDRWIEFTQQHDFAGLNNQANILESQLSYARHHRSLVASREQSNAPSFSLLRKPPISAEKQAQDVQEAQQQLEQVAQKMARVQGQLQKLRSDRSRVSGVAPQRKTLLFYAPAFADVLKGLEQRKLLELIVGVPELALQCRATRLCPSHPEREEYGLSVYWLSAAELAMGLLGPSEQLEDRAALQDLLDWQRRAVADASLVAEWLWNEERQSRHAEFTFDLDSG